MAIVGRTPTYQPRLQGLARGSAERQQFLASHPKIAAQQAAQYQGGMAAQMQPAPPPPGVAPVSVAPAAPVTPLPPAAAPGEARVALPTTVREDFSGLKRGTVGRANFLATHPKIAAEQAARYRGGMAARMAQPQAIGSALDQAAGGGGSSLWGQGQPAPGYRPTNVRFPYAR